MKRIGDFTNKDKIEIFDKIYKACRDEFNEAGKNEEHDKHYFWEYCMEEVLKIDEDDWNLHNDNRRVYPR